MEDQNVMIPIRIASSLSIIQCMKSNLISLPHKVIRVGDHFHDWWTAHLSLHSWFDTLIIVGLNGNSKVHKTHLKSMEYDPYIVW